MNKQFKVLTYVPDEELEDRINEASEGGKYVIKQMWRNKPFQGGVENTTVLMELQVQIYNTPQYVWPTFTPLPNTTIDPPFTYPTGPTTQVPEFTGQYR